MKLVYRVLELEDRIAAIHKKRKQSEKAEKMQPNL